MAVCLHWKPGYPAGVESGCTNDDIDLMFVTVAINKPPFSYLPHLLREYLDVVLVQGFEEAVAGLPITSS